MATKKKGTSVKGLPPTPSRAQSPGKPTGKGGVVEVGLIRGDGIGPEIVDATLAALEAAGARLRTRTLAAGETAIATHKDPLPEETLEALRTLGVGLKGPLGTPIGGGFRSVNVALRQALDLYANVRPAVSLPGVKTRYDGVDLIVVRENTEDLYAGVEHFVTPQRDAAESIAIITRLGSERIVRYAMELARSSGRKKVTIVHKANILKMTNGLFLECGRKIAKEYPELAWEEQIVDACCMKLVIDPTRFDVIVTMNLFGDILSDLTAGLIGGLGVAPAANIGAKGALFEAVHGTAPDIAGKGLANPTALMLSAAMLLDHVGQAESANRVRHGVEVALSDERTRTRDLGGKAGTKEFTRAVCGACQRI
jgi:isocitrate dehydrogenase (NAD+)